MNNECVITGCGVVSPAGLGVEPLWSAIAAGRPLAQPIDDPAFAALSIRRAGRIPAAIEPMLAGGGSRVAALMSLAADQAIRQAGWDRRVLADDSTGLCAATSKGDPARLFSLRGQWLAGTLNGQAGDFALTWPDASGVCLARRLGVTGPAVCSVAACGTGTHALIRAAQMIRDGDARRVLVAAADASVIPLLVAAFDRMGVLSPDDCCRPFDRNRNGFVLSEGAAAVTLEAGENAVGWPIARLAGFLTGADPTGLAAQDSTGATLARAIGILLARARVEPADVALYSAHATATPSNDAVEASAVRQAFGCRCPGSADRLRVIASKSVVGHLLGAAGLTEAIVAIEAMRRCVHPPVAGLNELDPACRVRVVRQAEQADLPAALCASLGFGGQFGLLALRRW